MGSDKKRDPGVSLGTPLAHSANAWHVCHICGTGKARQFKFDTQIDIGKSHLTNDKIPPTQAGRGQGPGANF